MKRYLSILLLQLTLVSAQCQDGVSFVTMNCYWFFGSETSKAADKPQSRQEYELKAGHLVGLLPPDPPLFIGLQEIGNNEDVEALARSATARYRHTYQPLFVQGKDTATKQDVGALIDTSTSWGVYGRPSRPVELDGELSKHLVVRLTNAVTAIDCCVVHLRRPLGDGGEEKQWEQVVALLKWSMRHLSKDVKANVIILGDFNEAKAPGAKAQSIEPLLQARPPMYDALTSLGGRIKTHADGRAYDRIFVSEAILKGESRLRFDSVEVMEHRHGKGEERRLYTDHFPVVVKIRQK